MVVSGSLVEVHNFYVMHAVWGPNEAQAELVVDANAVLPLEVSCQRFQVSKDKFCLLQGAR